MRIVLIFIYLFFAGCAVKNYNKTKTTHFDEDKILIRAIVNEYSNNLPISFNQFMYLYKKTGNLSYYSKAVQILLKQHKFHLVLEYANRILKDKFNESLFEYKVVALIELNRFKQAEKYLMKFKNKNLHFFYRSMILLYLRENNLLKVAFYTKQLYNLEPSKKNLILLTDSLIDIQQYDKALKYLQDYLKTHGCEYDVCIRIAKIYSLILDYSHLADIYSRLSFVDSKFAVLAYKYYIKSERLKDALNIANMYNLPLSYKLYIYSMLKDYKKAAQISFQIYKNSGNIQYLISYYEYKYLYDKSKNSVDEIVKNLKYIVNFYQTPEVYNFLGYLLIDYDIDYNLGLKFVKKALLNDPDNQLFLDSLAWGYYKLSKCKKAYDIIKKVKLKDKEILMHKKKIKECLKGKR